MNHQKLFLHLCIALVYCISVQELLFVDAYMQWINDECIASEKDFYAVQNKYNIAIGAENISGEKAEKYFRENTHKELFHTCDGEHFSIISVTGSTYHPPVINNWYEVIYKNGTYSYHTNHKVLGFSHFEYEHAIANQTDDAVVVHLTVKGQGIEDKQWYELATFKITMDYGLTAFDVSGLKGANSFPVFGHGKTPHALSCQFLKANVNRFID